MRQDEYSANEQGLYGRLASPNYRLINQQEAPADYKIRTGCNNCISGGYR